MRRKPEFYLWELQQVCGFLLERAQTRTEAEYLSDMELRFAVERAFILIGEIMSQLKVHFPVVSAQLDTHMAAIGLRNLIVHRYWDVDNRNVWKILTTHVEPLKSAVDKLLAHHPPLA